MIRNDWILQLIQEISRVVSGILLRSKAEGFTERMSDLNQASEKYTGLDFRTIQQLPPEALIDLFTVNGVADINKIFAAGMCVYAEALAYEDQADPAGLQLRQRKALHLLLVPFPYLESSGEAPTADRIEELRRGLVDYPLPDRIQLLLVPYLEKTGAYAEGENVLFDIDEGASDLRETGEAFYTALLKRSDDALEKGGLPRSEVEEGQLAFHARLDA